jgi:hypothetical protein
LLEENVELLRGTGDGWALGAPLYLGVVARASGQLDDARELVEEAAGLFRATGDKWRLAIALRELAEIGELGSDSEGARRLRHESEEARRELGRLRSSSAPLDDNGQPWTAPVASPGDLRDWIALLEREGELRSTHP